MNEPPVGHAPAMAVYKITPGESALKQWLWTMNKQPLTEDTYQRHESIAARKGIDNIPLA